MKDTITLTLNVEVKVFNKLLALAGEDVITSDEDLKKFDNLTLSSSELPDDEHQLATAGALYLAYGVQKEKDKKSE